MYQESMLAQRGIIGRSKKAQRYRDIELCDRNEFRTGQSVQVIAGDLTGLSGEIVECANESQLVIDLKNISRSLWMTIDTSQVMPLTLIV